MGAGRTAGAERGKGKMSDIDHTVLQILLWCFAGMGILVALGLLWIFSYFDARVSDLEKGK
jgi:hypothetical protein